MTRRGAISLCAVDQAIRNFASAIIRRGRIRKWDIGVHFLRFFNGTFRRLTFGASRLQEVHADFVSVTAYGKTAFECGLRQSIRRTIEFTGKYDRAVAAYLRRGTPIPSLYGASPPIDVMERERQERAIESVIANPSAEWDTHPSPAERIAFAGRVNAVDLPVSQAFLADCFPNIAALREEMDAVAGKVIVLEGEKTPAGP